MRWRLRRDPSAQVAAVLAFVISHTTFLAAQDDETGRCPKVVCKPLVTSGSSSLATHPRFHTFLRVSLSRIVIPSATEGSFLHCGQYRIGTYTETAPGCYVFLLSHIHRLSVCKEDFSLALEMTIRDLMSPSLQSLVTSHLRLLIPSHSSLATSFLVSSPPI